MTADEAKEIQKGKSRKRNWFFKFRLAWLCGIINNEIEEAADKGKPMVYIILGEKATGKYAQELASAYEDLGYFTAYSYKSGTFAIVWDPGSLTQNTKYELTNRYSNGEHQRVHAIYDYFTKGFF